MADVVRTVQWSAGFPAPCHFAPESASQPFTHQSRQASIPQRGWYEGMAYKPGVRSEKLNKYQLREGGGQIKVVNRRGSNRKLE